jgi:hypothetical protein
MRRKRRERNKHTDDLHVDEDGFGDDDVTGWFDALQVDLSRKDGHPDEEQAVDCYDPGLSDDSEDEGTVRKRNAMWSDDNKYHVYNAFVRHRRVNLEYVATLEQEIAESERGRCC